MLDHLFSTYDIEDKSLVEVIRVLGNIEASSGGQDKLTNEIKEVTNKRKRDGITLSTALQTDNCYQYWNTRYLY